MPILKKLPTGKKIDNTVFRPNPNAVLGACPDGCKTHMGRAVYSETEPNKIPADDIFALLRQSNDPSLALEKAYRERISNRGTAIRAFCVLCQGGPKAVRLCDDVTCPLWAFRMGGNPLLRRR